MKKNKSNQDVTPNQDVDQFQPYLDKMEDSTVKDYIKNRVLTQIDWYDQKSINKQKMYKRLSVLSIILNGLIPIAVLLSDYGMIIKLLIAALSSTAGILNSVIVLGNYKDLWIQYRSNCEMLKRTLHHYFMHSGEFEELDDNPIALQRQLANSCESFMAREFQEWVSSTNKSTLNSPEKTQP